MSAREDILRAIRKNKPEQSPLPVIPDFEQPVQDLTKNFEDTLIKIGGSFKQLAAIGELKSFIETTYVDKQMIVSNVEGYGGTHPLSSIKSPQELNKLDLAILQGEIALAENGCIWINGDSLGLRAVPFICEHLVLVFNRKDLVYNMHEAYRKLAGNSSSYGVFIAGPSKTADIEQALVIGAHGARSMTAVMIG